MSRSPTTVASFVVFVVVFVITLSALGRIPVVSGAPVRADADAGTKLDDAARSRTFSYAPGAHAAELQAWVASALARFQPHARRLIDAVDGQVVLHAHSQDVPVAGFVRPLQSEFMLSLDVEMLRMHSAEIRDHVVAHELGHVVDIALVPPAMNAQLDLSVPRIGGCTGEYADAGCAPPEERFADTFAKWALNDPVVLAGAQSVGYRVAPPANLALWGEPLVDLPA